MRFELESNHLLLRTLDSEYASSVCEFYQRNYDWLIRWEPNISKQFLLVEAMAKFMQADIKSMLSGISIRYWFSLKTSPDTILGSVNFQNIRRGAFKSCQIGYKIDKNFTGLGLASEAVRCAISSLFVDEQLHRIESIIATDNLASIRLSESLGFLKEGLSRDYANIDGVWKDCYQYSLLNGELKY